MLWIVQLVPFQRSTSGTSKPAVLSKVPTAVHAAIDEHDTAEMTPLGTEGAGTGWIAHAGLASSEATAGPAATPLRTGKPTVTVTTTADKRTRRRLASRPQTPEQASSVAPKPNLRPRPMTTPGPE
jgi:hypothetical protein